MQRDHLCAGCTPCAFCPVGHPHGVGCLTVTYAPSAGAIAREGKELAMTVLFVSYVGGFVASVAVMAAIFGRRARVSKTEV